MKIYTGFSNNLWQVLSTAKSLIELDKILLENRGIKKEVDQKKFFEKKFSDLASPSEIIDLDIAVKEVFENIKHNRKILIFGDYDADGIPASVLLEEFLLKVGANISTLIPNRADGYGLNQRSVKKIKEINPNLLITIDNGTNSSCEIDELKKSNIDSLIIDHHEITANKLPNCTLVNPKKNILNRQFFNLTAGGLVFKFISCYIQNIYHNESHWVNWLKWQMDLVAISTVCDVSSLTGENRILVDKGLIVLKQNKRDSLKHLLEIAGVDNSVIDTYTLGFIIGPRINATGRISDSNIGFEFLKSTGGKAIKMAKKIDKINRERQELFLKNYNLAMQMYEKNGHNRIAVLKHHSWQEGLVGLISAKITERKYIPSFVFRQCKDKYIGSARSIDGINLLSLSKDAQKYCEKFGGHEKAAGITIAKENFFKWEQSLIKEIEKIDSKLFIKKIKIDTAYPIEMIDRAIVDHLEKFTPFGLENPKPIFFDNAALRSIKKIGKNLQHFKLILQKDNWIGSAVIFNQESWFDKLKCNNVYNFIYEPVKSTWAQSGVDIIIRDISYEK